MNDKLSLSQKLSVAGSGSVQAFGIFFNLSILMYFFTDVLYIDARLVGILIFIERIFDAVNDPFFGHLIDRTAEKEKNMHRWIIYSGLALGIFIVLMYSKPEFGYPGGMPTTIGIAFTYIAYLGFGIAYTTSILSVLTLISRITYSPDTKIVASAFNRVGYAVFGILIGFFALPVIEHFGKQNTAHGYFAAAVIGAVIVAASSIFVSAANKKIIVKTEEKLKKSFLRSIKNILKNKPLIIIVTVALLLVTGSALSNGALLYYLTYNIQRVDLFSYIAPLLYASTLISSILLPFIIKKFGKRKSMFVSLAIAIACYAVRYITHDGTISILLITNIIFNLFSGLYMTIYMPVLFDIIDYGEYLTGERDDGLALSLDTFMQKLGMGFGAGIMGIILGSYNYVPNAETQTAEVIKGIFNCTVTYPLVLFAAALILLLFYKLKDNEIERIQKELFEKTYKIS